MEGSLLISTSVRCGEMRWEGGAEPEGILIWREDTHPGGDDEARRVDVGSWMPEGADLKQACSIKNLVCLSGVLRLELED